MLMSYLGVNCYHIKLSMGCNDIFYLYIECKFFNMFFLFQTGIKRPVFIIGLPRTGTTLLHQLLCVDPQFRAPMYWELMYPCPPGRPDNWEKCDRYEKAKKDFSECIDTRVELYTCTVAWVKKQSYITRW